METQYLVVPHVLSLRNEEGWEALGSDRATATSFFITRWHFVLERSRLGSETRRGELLGCCRCPHGSGMKVNDKYTREVSNLDLARTVETWIRESESATKLTTELIAGLEVRGVSKLSSKAATEATRRLKTSLATTSISEHVTTTTESHEWSVTFNIPPSETREYEVVAAYRKRKTTIYLACVDYLSVTYHVSMLGLRRKRKKLPIADGNDVLKRKNLIRCGWPLAVITNWERVPNSGWVIREDERSKYADVPDPGAAFELIENHSTGLVSKSQYARPRNNTPTLYQLAEAAFPIKWVKRDGNWTETDLRAIEANECKSEESHWGRRL